MFRFTYFSVFENSSIALFEGWYCFAMRNEGIVDLKKSKELTFVPLWNILSELCVNPSVF